MVHESAKHALEQRKKYSRWLDSDDGAVVANALLVIIGRALNMLNRQIEAQGRAFEESGGFSERLTAKRIEARDKDKVASPDCPQCGRSMRKRSSAKGYFWGCSAFPDCKGIRNIGED
jgi:restriction system protein